MNLACEAGPRNPFLDPILARWRCTPEALFGVFHDGEEWHPVHIDSFAFRARQFSALLRETGVATGDVVLIILEHGLDAHCAFFGALLLGAVPSFMPYPNVKQDAALYWRQHRDVFAHIRPRAILTFSALREAIVDASASTGARVLTPDLVNACTPADDLPVPEAGAVALLQHSSGTTGLKKGVQLTYRAIADQLLAYRDALGLDGVSAPTVVSWLPLYHDMGLISSFLLPIWHGAPIVSIDPFEWTREPALLFEAIETYGGTHCWLPNFALLHLARNVRSDRNWDLASLAAIICCSEPCKPEAFDAFLQRFEGCGLNPTALQASYAMAETVFAVTQTRLGAPVRRLEIDREALQVHGVVSPPRPNMKQTVLISNGPPIADCEVRVLKDAAFVGEGVVGEICITAPYLFSGYYNNKEATEQAFYGKWLRSGDLGFVDRGEIFIVGRTKDMIIVNGKNLMAHDVEAAVSRVPDVKPGRAVAFGFYVAALGSEQLVVVAEPLDPKADAAAVARKINRAVAAEVGVGCGDVRVVPQGSLVKTTSGKISRSENARKYAVQFRPDVAV